MSRPVAITLTLPEELAQLRFPASLDRRLQSLLDKNQEEGLSGDELAEAEGLVTVAEWVSMLRARVELTEATATGIEPAIRNADR